MPSISQNHAIPSMRNCFVPMERDAYSGMMIGKWMNLIVTTITLKSTTFLKNT